MKVEGDMTALQRPVVGDKGGAPLSPSAQDWRASELVTEVFSPLPRQRPRFVSRAPARLDVLGGLAEYTGGLVLAMTVADHACVAVETRTDGRFTLHATPACGPREERLSWEIPARSLQEASQNRDGVSSALGLLKEADTPFLRCVVGGVVEALRAELLADIEEGLSISLGSTFGPVTAAGCYAAVTAATVAAVMRAQNRSADEKAETMAGVCQRVENEWLATPVGLADAAAVLWGEPYTVLKVRCQPVTPAGWIRLPDDWVILGIDSGAAHPDSRQKYEHIRTAAFMGRALIERIVQYEDGPDAFAGRSLAQVTVADYVDRFRDRIPTKMLGRDYLERFGETGDSLTRVDPEQVYKIRSRTEHHIYEQARSLQFSKCLEDGIQSGNPQCFQEAGELMYTSHWSYGQRCGLGMVETDLLVSLLRSQGIEAGIYGAKTSGRGCGGVVTVLAQMSQETTAAIGRVIEVYETRTGRKATVLRGSSPGVLRAGVHQV